MFQDTPEATSTFRVAQVSAATKQLLVSIHVHLIQVVRGLYRWTIQLL